VASLYRPRIVTYCLRDGSYRTPDGKRVTKHTKGAVRKVTKSKKWYGRYTDGAGRQIRVPLSISKETSRRMLAKLAGDAQLASVGLDDPFEEHRDRPLLEHLDDYARYLQAKGNVAGHVAKVKAQCLAVIDGCRFKRIGDMQAAAVVEYLASLRSSKPAIPPGPKKTFTLVEVAALCGIRPTSVSRIVRRGLLQADGEGKDREFTRAALADLLERRARGIGITTSNHYQGAMKAFCRWLVRERRTNVDPLLHLSRQNPDTDVRRQRRALQEDRFASFIEATGKGGTFRGLTGADRLVVYTLAANTGFRASELGSLTPTSFDLGARPPTVTVRASYSKHRREDTQPLRADVAAMMRQYMAGKPKDAPLWPGTWTAAAAEMVRLDLAAAGIDYQDDAGRYFDFHAMRGQFISALAASGVHPKVAQVLARHSTIGLTMDHYTHLDVLDAAGALESLPGLPMAAERQKGKARARRADGAAAATAR
jgi:integrase